MLLRYRNRALLTQQDIRACGPAVHGHAAGDDDRLAAARAERANHNQLDRIIVRVDDSKYMSAVADVMRRMLKRRHNDVVDYEITVPELLLRQEQRTRSIFNIVLGAIASISLLVGGIGIMNIMLASVLERIREIGVRRATGATQKDILFQFLSEAMLISVAGGVAGIIVGAVISGGIEHFAGHHDRGVLALRAPRLRRLVHRGPRFRDRARVARRPAGSRRLPPLRIGHPMIRPVIPGVLLAALCLFAPAARGQDSLTLQQSIALAQKQGLQARAARDALAAALARDHAYGARLLPQISLAATVPNYSRAIVPVIQPSGAQLFTPLQQTTSQLGLTISQKLPFTGGNLSVSSSLQRFQMSGAQQVRTWSSAPMTVTLSQPILRPNTIKWDTREQDLRTEIAERQYLEARESVAAATASAFFDLYSARSALRNATHNAAVNDTLYTLNKGRYQVGKIGENDLLQSELALLRARTSVDGAKLDYDRALAAFRLAINVPANANVSIVVTSDVPVVPLDTARAVAEALHNSSTVTTLALQDVQARRAVTQARLGTGIGATLQASYGFNASGSAASAAYRNLLQAQQLSLGVQVPLIQWGAHSRRRPGRHGRSGAGVGHVAGHA